MATGSVITKSIELRRLLPGHQPVEDPCTDLISAALAALEGVLAARFVASGGARFEVDYDPRRVDSGAISRLADEAGEAARQRYAHERLRIQGIHCADCADKISAVTGKLAGVTSSVASYASEVLDIAYDRTAVGRPRIEREVESLGYKVVPAGAAPVGTATVGAATVGAAPSGANPSHGQSRDVHEHTTRTTDAGAASLQRQTPPRLRFRPAPDLLLSFTAGLALLIGFVVERTGQPMFAWLPFYLAAYAAGGWHATNHAVRAAAKGRFDIDILMVTAALGAGAIGAWAEGALLLFLFSLGHALERLAMDRARNAIRALADLTPKVARVVRAGTEVEVPVADLGIGERVIVRPGERIPADGQVVAGASMVDQAPITGESVPVLKEPGQEAFAGTINGAGALELVTTKGPEDTTLARVVKAVESAQSAKAPSHRFTDRFQRILTPVILVATALVIAVPPLFGVEFSTSFMRAMTLLVAASPCALALATPSAVLAGIARAARSGVLIKGGAHLENAGTAQVVVFDKTGTLTRGRPSVTDVVTAGNRSEDELLALAAAVESRSSHPLAAAVLEHADLRGLPALHEAGAGAVAAFEETVGHGADATVGGTRVLVGNRKLMQRAGTGLPDHLEVEAQRLEADGKTVMFVATGSIQGGGAPQAAGLIAVRDQPRPEAAATVAALKELGVRHVVMLSGDNRRVAEALGRELGIGEVRAELLPEEKAAAVQALRQSHGTVVMVGDGINDAPALAAADVGVAMGGAGSDVALETADIALMADDLSRLPYAVALSRASRRMIVQNLVISLAVIALLVPSSLAGLATIGIAVVLHESSTIVVVLNALRLLSYRGPKQLLAATA